MVGQLHTCMYVYPLSPNDQTQHIYTHTQVRYGLVEILQADEPLAGTPEPIGVLTTSEACFRKIALGVSSPGKAIASGEAKIEGNLAAFLNMSLMFEKGA